MFDLDKVEKLREKAGVSYEEARDVLTETNGDTVDAFILLEQRGRIPKAAQSAKADTASYSETVEAGKQAHSYSGSGAPKNTYKNDQISFGELLGRFFGFVGRVIRRGNSNSLHVTRQGEEIVAIPLTILVLLLIFAFWISFPLLIIGLFCGFRYQFSGPDLGTDTVNNTMNNVSDATKKAVYNVKEAAGDFAKDVKKGTGDYTHDETEGRGQDSNDGVDSSH